MERRTFSRDGLRFSYLDSGGKGRPLVALHAHIMEATHLCASGRAPRARVASSSHSTNVATDTPTTPPATPAPTTCKTSKPSSITSHLNDAVLLGNSLGGINAYQFAARHPEKVRGLIIEDIGVVISDEPSFVLAWEGVFPTREALAECIGPRFAPYLEDSFRKTPTGWKLAFEPKEIVASGKCTNGDHWHDWLSTDCPALLLRGRDSRVTTQAECEQMTSRRPNTRLAELDGSHVLHFENPTAFGDVVKKFLRAL